MERVIVEVFLPATGKKYDVRVPLDLNVGTVTAMVAEALAELSEGNYLPSKSSLLAWKDTGKLLDHAQTLRECSVKNTSQLILI